MPTPTFSGSSFQIDPRNDAYYQSPAVAALDDGRIATVYRNGGDGKDGNLRYVIHNTDGSVAFKYSIVDLADDVTVDNEMVNMAALPGGGFVVVWSERIGDSQNIYHRIFGADGKPEGPKVHSNADMPNGYAQRPDVVSDGKGGFYIAWDDMHYNNDGAQTRSIRMQHYDSEGATEASRRISDDRGADSNATIAINRDGSRVNVTWDDNLGNSGPNTDGIYGVEIGGEPGYYRADKGEFSEFHTDPDVAYSTGNTFMTVWNEYRGAGLGYAVYGSINGGEEFQINTMAHQHANTIQKVAGLRDGNFLVVWTDNGFDGNDDVMGQLVSATGEMVGEEFRISDRKSYFINRITVSETIDGQVVVTWDSPDGDIFARVVDPRQGAIDWTGDDSGEQFTGTRLADTLDGGSGDDVLQGLGGADVLIGGTGTDTATYFLARSGVRVDLGNMANNGGDAAGDVYTSIEIVTGSGFKDRLTGDSGHNTFNGLAGSDELVGNGGRDQMSGGDGDDVLIGGAGADTLVGGGGKDVFVFESIKDSSDKAGLDRILDFAKKQDEFDLSAIDANEGRKKDQAFDFIGASKFSKEEGELRYEFKKGDTYVHADTDGNGKADFSFVIDGEVKLTEGMFAL